MTNNFLGFIEKDIDAKKTLISTMPTRTKTNIKKYNEKLALIEDKYIEYKELVKRYLIAKSKSFELSKDDKNIGELSNKVNKLDVVRTLLDPTNSYFEKMGFDDLLYQIDNYYFFNFKSLDKILNAFLDKFELIGIKLQAEDFKFTYYVNEYMKSFLDVRYKKEESYDKVLATFEKIYWLNPEIINHIEVNMRLLIYKNKGKFNSYIQKLQKDAMYENNVKGYNDCVRQLRKAYNDLYLANQENAYDIMELARKGVFDINQYLPESKIRIAAFNGLINSNVNREDEDSMNKIYEALEKLRVNIVEFSTYNEINPLIDDFKAKYDKQVPKKDTKKEEYKGTKGVSIKIDDKMAQLNKINKKIFGGKLSFIKLYGENEIKQFKVDSVHLAKKVYDLYKLHDQEYFKEHVMNCLNASLMVSDVLDLFYSFNFFKKLSMKDVYKTNDYKEIVKLSDAFDRFAMDPTNQIVRGIPVFDDSNIAQVIANKYKLNNLSLLEEDLRPENLSALLNKVLLVLRVHTIEKSQTSMEKIWFMVQVDKILAKEEKKATE